MCLSATLSEFVSLHQVACGAVVDQGNVAAAGDQRLLLACTANVAVG